MPQEGNAFFGMELKHSLTKDYLKVPEMDGRKKFSGY